MEACDGLLTPVADTLAGRARWPSRVNPFLALGRAVVITRVGDLPELLEAEEAALVAKCDPEDIVRKILVLFSNPSVREQYEIQAKTVAEKLLSWAILTEELERFYLTL